MSKQRLEAFSDGVMAIAITILVLELKVPLDAGAHLLQSVLELLPKVLAFIFSFIVIGMYWVAHHSMVSGLQVFDRNALWINLLTLLFICFIPFPTALIGEYPDQPLGVILYSITLSLVNITGTYFWLHCSKLPQNGVPPKLSKRVAIIHMAPVLAYLCTIALSFFNVIAAYIVVALVPLFFIFVFPRKLIQRLLE
jgi:uncharacterized membrane protein